MAKRRLKKETKRAISRVILAMALLMGVFSGFQLWRINRKYAVAKKSYDDLRDTVVVKPVDRDAFQTAKDLFTPRKDIDWDALWAVDKNVVGWIEMENSSIDYPVAHGKDNYQYLRRLIDGTWSDAGTIFIDGDNTGDFSDRNTVIYGHHMHNEPLMFAELENFENQSYYDSHKVIMIHTPEVEYNVYPVAGINTTGTGGYLKFKFDSDEDYLNYVNSFIERSTFKSEETITAGDRMVLFSTCSYDVKNGRYVLIGKLEVVDSVEMHEHID